MKTKILLQSCIALVGCVLLTGCFTVPIPTAHYTADSRINLSKKKANRVTVGETTREEILLAFGEPDRMASDGSMVIYSWSRTYV